MNGGLHDGINLANNLVRIIRGGESDDLLDRYDRQRRPIAVEYVQAQTIRNKKNLEEKDPAVRKRRQDELRAVAEDAGKSRELLVRTSMINEVRKSEAIQ